MILAGMLAAGLVLLYFGADWLVRGSSRLALRAGVAPLVVGLTIVAFGTSAPELVVSTKAALNGQGGIAIGNVIGSNIFNIAVILGLSAVIRPLVVQSQLVRFDMPVMIGVSLVCWWLFSDGTLVRWEAGLLFAGIVAYTGWNIVMARRERAPVVLDEFAAAAPTGAKEGSAGKDLLLILGGLVLLVAGSRFLVDAAIQMARIWGVSEAVIGLTIVAAGTSLPELATSVIAAFRKQDDIAIGNVVGSNVFNILGILGVSGLVQPLDATGISTMDFSMMLLLAVMLWPLMQTGMRIIRWEGALLVAGYGAYLAWLWP
ncbi:MAG TPA: calcium/sodium antiporter [Kiritimatiellia bacterium]|nr:calcium/sodium antiporter [Kiritimatiellia bacterium]HMP33476.1 calcium/sodium antiporter [Kiritimatiellia bacterium]